MENIIKVGVVKLRTFSLDNSQTTSDNGVYPSFAIATTTFKVFLSDEIPDGMSVACDAVKEITDDVLTENLQLTADGPSVDVANTKHFSKELSMRAIDLLSAALPGYEFDIAEKVSDLKVEINRKDCEISSKGRLKAMKYLILAVIISTLTGFSSIPWAFYIVVAAFSLLTASILYCLVTWLVARIVKAGKISLSIGVIPGICLFRFKTADIFCGPFPFPDVAMPSTIVSKFYKCWTIGTIPPVIVSLIAYGLFYYRDRLREVLSGTLATVQLWQIVAFFAFSCLVVSVVSLTLYLDKSKDTYPDRAFMFTVMEYAIVIGGVMSIYQYGSEILQYLGI